MKGYVKGFVALLIGLGCSLPVEDARSQSDVPLLVVRYNQPHIYYDKQLYSAVSKAVAIKPSVVFSLVSFVPSAGDDAVSAAAGAQTSALVGKMQGMGVPAARIHVSNQSVNDSRYHEIYLYVD